VSWSSAALTVLRETESCCASVREPDGCRTEVSAEYGLPQSQIERALERLIPTLFQRSMEQGIKFITRYIHLISLWYQQNIAGGSF
jgi:hypothetical protein